MAGRVWPNPCTDPIDSAPSCILPAYLSRAARTGVPAERRELNGQGFK